jgi:hypothetical protein
VFETVVEPVCWGPQGMPTAGRESIAAGGAEGVVRGGEDGLVIKGVTGSSGDGVLAGCMIVAGDNGGVLVGVVFLGAGAVMVAGSVAFAGAGGADGIVFTEDGVSTLVGAFWDSGVVRSPITINNPTGTTTMTVSTTDANNGGRRRDVAGRCSVAPDTAAGSGNVMSSGSANDMSSGSANDIASSIPASGRTSVGATAFSASTSCLASTSRGPGAV